MACLYVGVYLAAMAALTPIALLPTWHETKHQARMPGGAALTWQNRPHLLLHLRQNRPALIGFPSDGEINASSAVAGVTSAASAAATGHCVHQRPGFYPACGFLSAAHVERRAQGDDDGSFAFRSMVKSSCSEAMLAVPVTLITAFSVSKANWPRHAVNQIQIPPPRSHPHLIVTKDLPDDVEVPDVQPQISIRLRLTSPSFISSLRLLPLLLSSAATEFPPRECPRFTVHFTEGFLHQLHVGHQLFQLKPARLYISPTLHRAFYRLPDECSRRWFRPLCQTSPAAADAGRHF